MEISLGQNELIIRIFIYWRIYNSLLVCELQDEMFKIEAEALLLGGLDGVPERLGNVVARL